MSRRGVIPRPRQFTPSPDLRSPSGWRTAAMDRARAHGRPFFCYEPPDILAGYYRFAAVVDAEPLGPFLTASAAQVAGAPRKPQSARHVHRGAATVAAEPSTGPESRENRQGVDFKRPRRRRRGK